MTGEGDNNKEADILLFLLEQEFKRGDSDEMAWSVKKIGELIDKHGVGSGEVKDK